MDQCRTCREVVPRGAKTCGDCADYEMATRIACRVLDECDVHSGVLAASIGAEIVKEVLVRRRLKAEPSLLAPSEPQASHAA